MSGPGRGGTANDLCVLSHKIETVDLKSAPSKMAGRFYLLLHCIHLASLDAPGGFIPISALLAHSVTAASDDGSLRYVGGSGGSTRPPMHASADSPGLRWHQNVPVAAGHNWRLMGASGLPSGRSTTAVGHVRTRRGRVQEIQDHRPPPRFRPRSPNNHRHSR